METRSADEVKGNVESFATRLINLQLDKKEIDAQIKDLKDEFKEEGVPIAMVVSVINRIKTLKKKTDAERFEEEAIKEWLETNTEIDNAIGTLIAK